MRRRRFGLAAAICAAALTAGCAAGGTTDAASSAGKARKPTASSVPTAPNSPSDVPTSAAPRTSAPALPEGYDATRNAKADIKAALATAAREHREVLIDFGADWCPDCRVLGGMFRSAQVEPVLRKDYVVVAVDVGQFDHNLDVADDYVNLRTSGIPALVVLKPDGTLRTATNDGSFADARTMSPAQIKAFLTHWAPRGNR
ncbi:thioredoxin family protein [Streptomyces sp. NBC_00820]|uniref:thioredoxin family protein n=1 Tax=Streptomyces sp. NBC_00820 TaxID=2975842 RepID=UPI002ED3F9D5|nr:thioredoxin family protein [Streptomyces sp. NBC_00820]